MRSVLLMCRNPHVLTEWMKSDCQNPSPAVMSIANPLGWLVESSFGVQVHTHFEATFLVFTLSRFSMEGWRLHSKSDVCLVDASVLGLWVKCMKNSTFDLWQEIKLWNSVVTAMHLTCCLSFNHGCKETNVTFWFAGKNHFADGFEIQPLFGSFFHVKFIPSHVSSSRLWRSPERPQGEICCWGNEGNPINI